jgi:hypothetical protein
MAAASLRLCAALGAAAASASAAAVSVSVVADAAAPRGLKVVPGAAPPAGALAWATYDAGLLLTTGWATLSLGATGDAAAANASFAGFAAGYVEGYLTFLEMEQWSANTGADAANSKKLQAFLDANLAWTRAQAAANRSAYWQHVGALLAQVDGLAAGQADAAAAAGRTPIGFQTVYNSIIQGGDIFNLAQVYGVSSAQRVRTPALRRLVESGRAAVEGVVVGGGGSGGGAAAPRAAAAAAAHLPSGRADHCSALVRLLPDGSDVLLTHTTWSGMENMLRIAKTFDLPFAQVSNGAAVPGRFTTVPSYPTFATYSSDDFYSMLPSKLVAIETTINNDNVSLAEEFASTEVVLEWARNVLANRLAATTGEWADVFSAYASGTYTNSWMVFDAKRFTPGAAVPAGAFIVLEEMPGNIAVHDRAESLNGRGYWSSFNVASDPHIFDISGQQKNVDDYGGCATPDSNGCFFTLLNTSRARIFDRGAPAVTDEESLRALIRYNGAASGDELAALFCSAPGDVSYANAIADRSDLNAKRSSCFAGGHGDSGAIDAKYTRASWVQKGGAAPVMMMQSGPTNLDSVPTFSWSNTTLKADHVGLPDTYDFAWLSFPL